MRTISSCLVLLGTALGIASASRAVPIHVEMTSINGLVPGTTVAYTISNNADGGARNIFLGANSSDAQVWNWLNGFPEFLAIGTPQTLTVTFSAPISINRVVVGLNSTSYSVSHLSVSGGTAELSDIDLLDSIEAFNGPYGAAVYDAIAGTVVANGPSQSIILGSTSSRSLTSLTLNAGSSGIPNWPDGYTAFVGFTVPEPSTALLLGLGLVGLAARRRV